MSKNRVMLNFQDVLLHESDIDLLKGPHWLNDNIITFYFEYLEKLAFEGETRLLFISPEVVQCLKASKQNDLPIFLDPLNAKQKKFIFMPLNNCEISDRPGGSHWSLLVFSKPEESFFHFDSLSGSNYNQAAKLAGKLLSYLSSSNGSGEFVEHDTLQQNNSYDCGIFVLCNVDFLIEKCLKNNKICTSGKILESCVSRKRVHVLDIINDLKKKGY